MEENKEKCPTDMHPTWEGYNEAADGDQVSKRVAELENERANGWKAGELEVGPISGEDGKSTVIGEGDTPQGTPAKFGSITINDNEYDGIHMAFIAWVNRGIKTRREGENVQDILDMYITLRDVYKKNDDVIFWFGYVTGRSLADNFGIDLKLLHYVYAGMLTQCILESADLNTNLANAGAEGLDNDETEETDEATK